jgi:predicted nucleotidyltransferase component of viral defense system
MEILTPLQVDILTALGKTHLRNSFFLAGGTALSAFFLKHRYSEDLDFFTGEVGQVQQVLPVVEEIANLLHLRVEVRRQFAAFLELFLHSHEGEIVKCDFAQDSPFRLLPVVHHSSFAMPTDNALDIACNKLSALFDRAESKDFVDVFFIDKELSPFPQLLEQAKKKHVGLDNYWLAISLLKVEDMKTLPRMVKPLDQSELEAFFLAQAKLLMESKP